MNVVEYWNDGATLARTLLSNGDGTAVETFYDELGRPIETKTIETSSAAKEPLAPSGALATLLVVVGVLGIADAANAVGVSPEDLIAEAEAWALQ